MRMCAPSADFTAEFLTLLASQLLPAISFLFFPVPSSQRYCLLAECATRLLLLLASVIQHWCTATSVNCTACSRHHKTMDLDALLPKLLAAAERCMGTC
jgi:hypothetical protein